MDFNKLRGSKNVRIIGLVVLLLIAVALFIML